jgi:hypothetical protein
VFFSQVSTLTEEDALLPVSSGARIPVKQIYLRYLIHALQWNRVAVISDILNCPEEDLDALCGELAPPVVYMLLPAAIAGCQKDLLLVVHTARQRRRTVANHLERAWLFDEVVPFLGGIVARIPDFETLLPGETKTVRELLCPDLIAMVDTLMDVIRDTKFQYSPLLPVREHSFRAFLALCFRRGINGSRYPSAQLSRIASGGVLTEQKHSQNPRHSTTFMSVVTGGDRLRVLFHQGAIASQLGSLSLSEVSLCEQKIIVGLFSEYCQLYRGFTLSGNLQRQAMRDTYFNSTVPTNLLEEHQQAVKSRRRSQLSITCRVLLPSGVQSARKSDADTSATAGRRSRATQDLLPAVRQVSRQSQVVDEHLSPVFQTDKSTGSSPSDMIGEGFYHLVSIFRAHYKTVLVHDMSAQSRVKNHWKKRILKSRDTGAILGPSSRGQASSVKAVELASKRRSFHVPVSRSTVVRF